MQAPADWSSVIKEIMQHHGYTIQRIARELSIAEPTLKSIYFKKTKRPSNIVVRKLMRLYYQLEYLNPPVPGTKPTKKGGMKKDSS